MTTPTPVRTIPSTMQVVDASTGEVREEKPMVWHLLPPPADHCQICAVKHEPALPHNPRSLYYQTAFESRHGRPATWADAMAHCTAEMQAQWKAHILDIDAKQWSEPPAGVAPIAHHGAPSA